MTEQTSNSLSRRAPHRSLRGTRVGFSAGCAVLSLTLAACAPGLDSIDRRLARVIGESATQSSLTTQPRLEDPTPIPSRRPGLYEDEPPSDNPTATDLEFQELNRGEAGSKEVIVGLNSRLREFAGRASGVGRDDVMEVSLRDALRLAQRQGREYRSAEEDYLFTAISLLIERHRWGPRLFADSSVSVSGDGDEGQFDNALNVVNTLRATQRLPYGGDVEARWVWQASEQLRSSVSGQYRQSSALVLDADLPLLRGSGMVARESRIQSERDLVYAARDFEAFRRSYFVSIAQEYFQLLETVSRLQNEINRLESLQLFVRGEEAMYAAGRRSLSAVNDARNQLLGAEGSLANAREQYTLQVDRLKVRLGLPIEQPVRPVGATIDVSEPTTDVEDAARAALSYRLDVQNRQDRLVDTQRSVLIARDQLRADLNLNGNVRIPTDPDVSEGGLAIDPDEASWEAGLILSLPLDRRIERLQLRQALIRLEQDQRSLDEFLDNVVLDSRQSVREIDLARFSLELSERQVAVNELRLREQILNPDGFNTRDRLDAESDLLNSRNSRDQALTDLRISILDYLDATGQLRVGVDGLIDPIPGMRVEIAESPIDIDALFNETPTDPSVYEPLVAPAQDGNDAGGGG